MFQVAARLAVGHKADATANHRLKPEVKVWFGNELQIDSCKLESRRKGETRETEKVFRGQLIFSKG